MTNPCPPFGGHGSLSVGIMTTSLVIRTDLLWRMDRRADPDVGVPGVEAVVGTSDLAGEHGVEYDT
eukprot:CAMPEP_0175077146 /NCGR_PEP_ID=MMETSP0052_2-20121109/23201_1 /TAXON_ID=51329 ORGANISM="Polytomella parva, Strain SAG 63-3" /NCGR_SAMPLE_ID=MMETSP0052_2 /ASSEMBLY_ACC=CAM_ASM_000194 /LENGTH=65 /DNA_ID=CAMNT_0016346525 /DNA_START=54 /DNA_END=251 /DNA_ORIENTATION=+